MVLPHPDDPSKKKSEPDETSILTSSTATVWSNVFRMFVRRRLVTHERIVNRWNQRVRTVQLLRAMGNPLQHLHDLQKRRGARSANTIPVDSIRSDITRLRTTVEKHAQRFGDAAELWERFIPANVRDDTRLSGISGGVLTVVTGSAATSYTLDRILRGGVDAEIRNASAGKITRVRMRVGQVNPPQ